jgi:bifunctional lysine-specific demethylase and histidyl-hydroxylase NO66
VTPLPALLRATGLDAGTFAREHWNTRPLLARAAELPRDFSDLLSVAEVDELLGPRGLRTPFFRLVQEGRSPSSASYTRSAVAGDRRLNDLADSARVAEQFAAGHSVVLNAMHRVHPPLAEFCRALSTELGHPTQVNVYVTPPGAQGFRAHHDTHDVLVLQIDGTKHWRVYDPVVQLPLPSQPSSGLPADVVASGEPVLDVELGPGDALYLPRGWRHAATTAADRSIHLTVGILQTTWFDVLGDVVRWAAEEVDLRAALPLTAASADSDADAAAMLKRAAEWLGSLPAERVRELVSARRARAVPVEPVGVLAQEEAARTASPQTVVRRRAGLVLTVSDVADRAVLRLPDREVSVPGEYGEALRAAVAGPAVAAGELGVDPADGAVLVRRLLREGAVVPVGR